MINTTINADDERKAFACEAGKYFANNKECNTYTASEITKGCLFAIRWGFSKDCVVVFKLDEYEDIINYQGLVSDYE